MKQKPLGLLLVFCLCSHQETRAANEVENLAKTVLLDATPLKEPDQVAFSYRNAVKAARNSMVVVVAQKWQNTRYPDLPPSDWNSDANKQRVQEGRGETGSGIVLTAAGLILTNHHVVAGSARITLRSPGMETEVEAGIVGSDPSTDVALLRARSGSWTPGIFGDSNQVEPGDVVLALGNPYGLEHSVSMGIISATGRSDIRSLNTSLQDFLQTDAAIHPGNSGGPLVDGLGRIIGMTAARFGSENIALAVPSNLALKVAQDLLDHGRVQRGFMGVQLQNLTQEQAQKMALPAGTRGVLIAQVETGSSAHRSGLLPGDVIKTLNSHSVASAASLMTRMTLLKKGDWVELQILRDGKSARYDVQLGEPKESQVMPPSLEWELVSGLKVALLDKRLRDKWLLPSHLNALRVMEDYLLDGKRLLQAGDLITQVNGRNVSMAARQPDPKSSLRFRSPILMLHVQRQKETLMIGVHQEHEVPSVKRDDQ
ncbi:trypsin-like peptidase domain-containing protein [Prosthecobacter sp. SYSU 5D2]|uniref:S1C family serine protease n=1 Tax=Prosthecobacter sp. SYSU 5D2 TaxID=3134134 RepID=UPI0031FE46EE